MFEKDPSTHDWVTSLIAWAAHHYPYVAWGGITAFFFALWSSLRDGKGWLFSIFAAVLGAVMAISIIVGLKEAGVHTKWLPVVGMIVGFIGADRIRATLLGMWEIRKKRFMDRE
ncbi:phage holin family protein [Yokenella regensburgei]|uniref:phage holin family protein n=1 Tax=Yokenella regensburgei TaxID=158877 RepID=UPI0031DF599A